MNELQQKLLLDRILMIIIHNFNNFNEERIREQIKMQISIVLNH